MNVVRKLLDEHYNEVKEALDSAYYAVERFQDNRESLEYQDKMKNKILETTAVLEIFKEHIPGYKQKYFDIVKNYETLELSNRDLIMAFDRMVYELHSRLERHKAETTDMQSWSPLMMEILDGRREIVATNNEKNNFKEEFITSGLSVVGGKVRGNIKIINSNEDYEKVSRGDIIVSKMTSPEMILVVDKIGGIITERGGRTCHAAIIAREYNIPCVVGCGDFMSFVEDGECLLLDANTGIVFR